MNILKSISNYLFSNERKKILTELRKDLEKFKEDITQVIKEKDNDINIYSNKLNLNGKTILIFNDGKILEKEDPNKHIYNAITNQKTRKELEDLFIFEDIEKNITIKKEDLYILSTDENFTCTPEGVYLKDISWLLPDVIVADFIELKEKIQYATLKNDLAEIEKYKDLYVRLYKFTVKLAYSPIIEKENVLSYCIKNDVRLSKRGSIIGYRRVNKHSISKSPDPTFEYVFEMYTKIKKWKKSPLNYTVYKDDFLVTVGNSKKHPFKNKIGNLYELYLLGDRGTNVQLYTSAHNAGKYVFPIPSLYKMEGEVPNPSLSNCHSGGLKCVASL